MKAYIVGILIGIRELDKLVRVLKQILYANLVTNIFFMLIPFIKAIDFLCKVIISTELYQNE